MSHSNTFTGILGNVATPNEHTFSNTNEPTVVARKPPIKNMGYKLSLQKPLKVTQFPFFVNVVNINTSSYNEEQRPHLPEQMIRSKNPQRLIFWEEIHYPTTAEANGKSASAVYGIVFQPCFTFQT